MVLAHLFGRVPMQPGWAKHLKDRAEREGECVITLPELPDYAQAVVDAYQAEVCTGDGSSQLWGMGHRVEASSESTTQISGAFHDQAVLGRVRQERRG